MTLISLFSILLALIFLLPVLFLVQAPLPFSCLNPQIIWYAISKIAFEILFIHIFLIFFFKFFRQNQMTKYWLFILFVKVNFDFAHFKYYLYWLFTQLIELAMIIDLLEQLFNFHYSKYFYFRSHFWYQEFSLSFSWFLNI